MRPAGNLIVGVRGDKSNGLKMKQEIKTFFKKRLQAILNDNKITYAKFLAAKFLGYTIHINKIERTEINFFFIRKITKKSTKLCTNAFIRGILTKLSQKSYVKFNNSNIKRVKPAKNSQFINLTLKTIIKYYKTIELVILNYYFLTSNFVKLSACVRYILKYSCALTIVSKMKLKTLGRVFSKYKKLLSVSKLNEKLT
jgi:hypothetical protein